MLDGEQGDGNHHMETGDKKVARRESKIVCGSHKRDNVVAELHELLRRGDGYMRLIKATEMAAADAPIRGKKKRLQQRHPHPSSVSPSIQCPPAAAAITATAFCFGDNLRPCWARRILPPLITTTRTTATRLVEAVANRFLCFCRHQVPLPPPQLWSPMAARA